MPDTNNLYPQHSIVEHAQIFNHLLHHRNDNIQSNRFYFKVHHFYITYM